MSESISKRYGGFEGNFQMRKDRKTIEELEDPLFKILEQLSSRISAGEYRIIIGDDASGRVPTLILTHVIDAVYKRLGMEKPIVRFIAGSTGLEDESARANKGSLLEKQIGRIALDAGIGVPKDNERVLVVTDTISRGQSVEFLTKVLRSRNLESDVATVAYSSHTNIEAIKDRIGSSIVTGYEGTPKVYGKTGLSGVVKRPDELFARLLSNPQDPQHRINYAREVAKEVAERLTERFISSDEEMKKAA